MDTKPLALAPVTASAEQDLNANTSSLRVGDPVRLKDSDLDLRGDVWQLRTGQYVVVRWEDECRSTHSVSAIEFDRSRNRAEWSRLIANDDPLSSFAASR